MKSINIASLQTYLLAIVVCVSTAGYAQAQTSEVLNPPTPSKSKKKAKKVKADGGSKATFIDKTGETKSVRERRLKRECKDAVNAGACTGYTR